MREPKDLLERASEREQFERDQLLAARKQEKKAEESAKQTRDEQGRVICEDCETIIHPARLEALPHAVLCVECQQTEEYRNRPTA